MKSDISIALGSDHAGFELKEFIKQELLKNGYKIHDFGAFTCESLDDFPSYAEKVSMAVTKNEYSKGILFCGTGIGMSIAANKVKGIRAAVCWNRYTSKVSRVHNNSNILCLGGRVLSQKRALGIVRIWLSEEYEGGRHQRRIDLVNEIENKLR